MIQIFKFDTPEIAAENASKALNSELKKYKNIPILLLLSGGSALTLLDRVDAVGLSEDVTISPLDERFSEKNNVNNMAQIATTDFYKVAKSQGCSFIDTRISKGETQERLANRFENSLNEWFRNNPRGKVLATVGIGPDGHTSGMMPFPENPKKFYSLFDNEEFVVGYDAGSKNEFPKRVTTTITFLRKIDTAIVYAVGDNKKNTLLSLKSKSGSLAETPARILNELPSVSVYTDLQI